MFFRALFAASTKVQWKATAVATILIAATLAAKVSQGALTFTIGGSWDIQARADSAWWAMTNVVNRYNNYGDFGNYNIWVYYDAGIPTAQASWGGSIGFGGTWPNERVTLHESNHYLGSVYGHTFDGPRVIALIEQFDGLGARISHDSMHFWPYGLNYDNEWSEIAAQRNIAIMYAMRRDNGIGNAADPAAWAATSVTLTANDAVGESGFNYGSTWSDGTFAHYNANYFTNNFVLRTPASAASFNFAGKSVTVNNTNGMNGGLLYKGTGTSGIITFSSLILNGGYVRHASSTADLFQLAGNVSLSGATSFDAAEGDIKVLAAISGSGSLTKLGAHTLTLSGANTSTGSTTVLAGRLVLDNISLGNSSGVSLSTGAMLSIKGASTIGAGLSSSSGTVDLADGAMGTFSVNGNINLSSSTLKMEVSGANSDRIVATGSVSAGGTNTVNVQITNGVSVVPGSSYTLLSATGGLNASNFAPGSKPAALGFMQLNLATPTSTALMLNVTGNPIPSVAYWTGKASSSAGDSSGNWGTGPSISKSNWSTDAAGTTDPLQLPGSTTNVIFSAAAGATGTLTTQLDSAYGVGGITFAAPFNGVSATTLNTNGNVLTIGSSGITLAATSYSAATISGSGSIFLNGSQNWANNSNSRALAISSGISSLTGSPVLTFNGTGTAGVTISGVIADGLGKLAAVFSQTGTTVLSGANTFTGNVVINSGTVNAANGANVIARSSGPLGNPNTAGRTVAVNGGSTLALTVGNVLGSGGQTTSPALAITVNSVGVLKTATTDVGGDGGGDANIFGNLNLNGGTFTTGNGYSTQYQSAILLGTVTVGGSSASTINTNASNTVANGLMLSASGGVTFNVGTTGAAGIDLNVSAPLTNSNSGSAGSLIKIGAGTMRLIANNTFTGSAIVNAGTLTLSGGNARMVGSPIIANGVGTTGTMNIASGAILTSPDELSITNDGGTGTLNVLIGGTLNANGYLTVGRGFGATNAANSTLNVLGGTVNSSATLPFVTGSYGNSANVAITNIAYGSDGTTSGIVNGAFETWIADNGATGTMNVSAGGVLNANNSLVVGREGGIGTLNVSGSGSINKNSAGSFYVAYSSTTSGATGIVNQTGGSVSSAVALSFANLAVDSGTYNLSGGTLTVPQVVRTAGSGTFNFNGGALRAAAGANSAFMTGLTTANVRNGGAFIDTNNQNVMVGQALLHSAIAGDAAIDGGLTKKGAGTLTLTVNSLYTGPTNINGGTVRLAPMPVSIAHRWSFNNSSLADSVGNSPASVIEVGSNNVSFSSAKVTLAGGAQNASDYISLGSGLLPKTNTPVTIELWATQNAVQNWSRIFDLGSSSSENLFMSWTQGSTLASDRVEWKDTATSTTDNTNQPFTLGIPYHIVMVLDPAGNGTNVTWYATRANNVLMGAARGMFTTTNTLASFVDSADNLGRSFYADNTASASYDEVRLWNGALNAAALQSLHSAGPDANLSFIDQAFAGHLPSTTALNLTAAGATFDLNGINQTVASVFGVPGSNIILGSAILTVNSTTSTTFDGAISGSGAIVMTGSGTLTLNGPLSYTGNTTVVNGTLSVNNLNMPNATIAVFNSALLSADSLTCNTLTIGGSAPLAVPEPAEIGLLAVVAAVSLAWLANRWLRR